MTNYVWHYYNADLNNFWTVVHNTSSMSCRVVLRNNSGEIDTADGEYNRELIHEMAKKPREGYKHIVDSQEISKLWPTWQKDIHLQLT